MDLYQPTTIAGIFLSARLHRPSARTEQLLAGRTSHVLSSISDPQTRLRALLPVAISHSLSRNDTHPSARSLAGSALVSCAHSSELPTPAPYTPCLAQGSTLQSTRHPQHSRV